MEELVYMNGTMVPQSQASISVLDHGFLYGYALFETMRAYNGNIFLLERHLKRLADAADIIGLSLAETDLAEACKKTIIANELKEARLRLTVTNGDADSFPWAVPASHPTTVVIIGRPFTPLPPEKYGQGFRLKISTLKRCAHSAISGVKSNNYLVNVMARMEATRQGFDEALLMDDRGFIAEGSTSNIFFVKGASLVTPSANCGILPGITRGLVIELARELDINVIETDIRIRELAGFNEGFLTSSTMEIMPVLAITLENGEEVVFGNALPGMMTQQLVEAYRKRVEGETSG